MTLLIVLLSLIADAARLINQPRMSRRALPIHQDGAHSCATPDIMRAYGAGLQPENTLMMYCIKLRGPTAGLGAAPEG